MGEMSDDARAEYYVHRATEEAIEKARPKSLKSLKCTDPDMWERANGSKVLLVDMTDDHLEAALHVMLGFRAAERRYIKQNNLSFYSKDPVLDYRLNQLTREWVRRFQMPGFLKKLTRKIFK